MKALLFAGGLALILSLLGTRVAINVLSRRGYGQEIREDGPTSHHTKRGTPTMGGIVIIGAAVLAYFVAKLITGQVPSASAMLLLFLFVGCAASSASSTTSSRSSSSATSGFARRPR
jgi:phospho-N-acetylmuramoyl-pentapeptide-transferase